MRFVVPCSSRVGLSVAAAHGAADAARSPTQLLLYSVALLPLPGALCTAAFAACSVLHFSDDVGGVGSVALHAATLALASRSCGLATRLMLVYINRVHVPVLVMRLLARGAWTALACVACASAAFIACGVPRVEDGGTFEFGHRQQMIVVCHVILSRAFPLY